MYCDRILLQLKFIIDSSSIKYTVYIMVVPRSKNTINYILHEKRNSVLYYCTYTTV